MTGDDFDSEVLFWALLAIAALAWFLWPRRGDRDSKPPGDDWGGDL